MSRIAPVLNALLADKFQVEVKGDSLIQKGLNNSYNEVWRRVK